VTRSTPMTRHGDQNQPVHVRSSAYTDSMRTAEIRGILLQLRVDEETKNTFSCSWFESRYPSSNRRKFPGRNYPSPSFLSGLNRPLCSRLPRAPVEYGPDREHDPVTQAKRPIPVQLGPAIPKSPPGSRDVRSAGLVAPYRSNGKTTGSDTPHVVVASAVDKL
jgi:hypothetical protein